MILVLVVLLTIHHPVSAAHLPALYGATPLGARVGFGVLVGLRVLVGAFVRVGAFVLAGLRVLVGAFVRTTVVVTPINC